jgi:hypothetical protein
MARRAVFGKFEDVRLDAFVDEYSSLTKTGSLSLRRVRSLSTALKLRGRANVR